MYASMTVSSPDHSDEHRRRLELALEAAGLGEFEWDVARDVIYVSERMSAIMGLTPGDMPAEGGKALNRFIHPDDLADVLENQSRRRNQGGTYGFEFRHLRPDNGAVVWLRVAGIMRLGADGLPLGNTGIVEDITAHKLEDVQRQTLMSELDHRVKNVLAAVQALAVQTARRTTSLDAFLLNFSGRLKAMGAANELLTAARWRRHRPPGGGRAGGAGPGPGDLGRAGAVPDATRGQCPGAGPARAGGQCGEVRGALAGHRPRAGGVDQGGGRWLRTDLDGDRRPDGHRADQARLRLDPA
jgi:PAS domain S-box-containing protein